MTYTALLYKPPTVYMLCKLLERMRREETKQRFARDTMCYLLMAYAPKVNRSIYSDFVETLCDDVDRVEMTPEEIAAKRREIIRKNNEESI